MESEEEYDDDIRECEECGEELEEFEEEICTYCSDSYEETSGSELIDSVGFADPGGNSSLRAETSRNLRNLPCPTCKMPNKLTPIDVRNHYQCNDCADNSEGAY